MVAKRKTYRLVSKKTNKSSGSRHVSSSSDGIVDYAAAVIAGEIPAIGLPIVLPTKYYSRANRLLKNNEIAEVTAKVTPRSDQLRGKIRKDLSKALPRIIGQVYKLENQGKLTAQKYLSTKTVIDWIIRSLKEPGSRLNRALERAGYEDLVELKRSRRWWRDQLELSKNRKKAE
jgi:hypothetical protein